MATFDPDAYLGIKMQPAAPAVGGFDPDAWLRSKAPPGYRAVQPGEIPTASGFYALPDAIPQRTTGQRILGAVAAPVDIALTLGSAAGRGIVAPMLGEQRGGALLRGIRQPQTPEGAAVLEAAAPALSALPPFLGVGLPYVGAAPQAARQAGRTAAQAGGTAATTALKPLQPMLERRAEARSLESYARAPQIDAAKDAQRLGIVLNPTDIQPSAGARLISAAAGSRGAERIVEVNRPAVNKIARSDMGMPQAAVLKDSKPFDDARAAIAEPYNKIRQIPVIQADQEALAALNALRPGEIIIGGEAASRAINARVDSAVKQMTTGLSGSAFLDSISKLRKDARRIYNNPSADPVQLDLADTNMAIANILEQGADRSVFDPKLLRDYQDARQKMARIYAYQAATDYNTGLVDPTKIARITAKDNALTGDLAALGRIAGNFPDAFNVNPSSPWYQARVARSGFGGAAGTALGAALAPTGAVTESMIAGGLLGGFLGEAGSRYAANKLVSPDYQAGLRVPDYRRPQNNLIPPIPQNRAVVPYQTPIEVLPPGAGPYRPNFVMRPNEYPPGAQFVGPEGGPPQLPAPSAESTMATLRAEDARRAAMSRTLGREAEAQQAAAEAAARRPATGEVILDFDPVTGELRPVQQQGAALPQRSALQSAVEKLSGQMIAETESTFRRVSTGRPTKTGEQRFYVRQQTEVLPSERQPQAFNLTAEERIAWNKAKADLADVAPGFKALDEKAIAAKMQDREWVQNTIKSARERDQALARKEALLAEQLANRDNLRLLARDIERKNKELADIRESRARMTGALEALEERLRPGRPQVLGGQGPKTRAAKAEASRGVNSMPGAENRNNLAP
jgi:hypothetical protein